MPGTWHRKGDLLPAGSIHFCLPPSHAVTENVSPVCPRPVQVPDPWESWPTSALLLRCFLSEGEKRHFPNCCPGDRGLHWGFCCGRKRNLSKPQRTRSLHQTRAGRRRRSGKSSQPGGLPRERAPEGGREGLVEEINLKNTATVPVQSATQFSCATDSWVSREISLLSLQSSFGILLSSRRLFIALTLIYVIQSPTCSSHSENLSSDLYCTDSTRGSLHEAGKQHDE